MLTLLNDAEWSQWSDREIARRVAVDNSWVGDIRRSLLVTHSEPRTYTTKHGTVAQMNTEKIGRAPSGVAVLD